MKNMLPHGPMAKLPKLLFLLALCAVGASCSKVSTSADGGSPHTVGAAKLISGTALISGSGVTKGTVGLTSTTLVYNNVGMVQFDEAWSGKELLIDLGTYDQASQFGGQNASISLVAETQNYPLSGGAYAVLTSFYVDPTGGGARIEYVNVTSQCSTQGMWNCSGGLCHANAACTVQSPSGFGGRTDWDQHQVPPYGYSTTNTFPRCDASVAGWSTCPAGWNGLIGGHYYAKYLLLSDSGGSVASTRANLKITVLVKKDTQARDIASTNGGINLNVILVGDHNINDSHTTAGDRNLNLLFTEVNRLFSVSSGAKLAINSVKTYEWTDANGGSQYSQVDYASLGDLFEAGSKGVDASGNEQNINIFILSDIEISGTNFTILGLSGAILGPPINGTQTSGLAFASFNHLASYNPGCLASNCARETQEADFLEMAATITHELGHYLGLNHPSEKPDASGNQTHDFLIDTPTCLARGAGTKILDQRACYVSDTTVQGAPLSGSCATACNTATGGNGSSLTSSYLTATPASAALVDPWSGYSNSDMPGKFCPNVQECQFNHVMWYTTKNRRLQKADGSTCTSGDVTTGGLCTWNEDGNLFSPESQAILQWDPFVH